MANSLKKVLEVSLIGWAVHHDQVNGVFEDVMIRLIYSNDLKETLG